VAHGEFTDKHIDLVVFTVEQHATITIQQIELSIGVVAVCLQEVC
jgi:hypothetical protein